MNIDTIIIHCADTPNGMKLTAKDIDDWHRQRGWLRQPPIKINPQLTSIGYHFVILLDGTIETGRSEDEIGAQALMYNDRSLGICLIGRDRFTDKQWYRLDNLVSDLFNKYNAPKVIGHRDVAPHKTCPGFDVTTWMVDKKPSPEHILEQPAIG